MDSTSLTNFVESVCNESHLRVETDLGGGFVRLKSEEAERRQAAHDIRTTEDALIELLRNSRDAHAHSIFIATSKSERVRKLLVIDDGDGIPDFMKELVFEPRVTSKLDTMHFDKWGVHGRGMALYAVRTNAQACGVVQSQPAAGTALFADFNTDSVSEKTDQSTFPAFSLNENNRISVRGPKNIIRTSCEFAFEHRNSVSVYLGSPVEIAATLYAYGKATLSLLDRTFMHDESAIVITKKLALAADEESFCDVARSMGIELSTRSAYRILGGQIAPIDPLLDQIQDSLLQQNAKPPVRSAKKGHEAAPKGKRKPISFAADDLSDFTMRVKKEYKELAESYYLAKDVDVHAQVRGDALIVRIPLASDDSL